MAIIATGIDLAKNVFAVHRVNGGGVALLRQPRFARGKLSALLGGCRLASAAREPAREPTIGRGSFGCKGTPRGRWRPSW